MWGGSWRVGAGMSAGGVFEGGGGGASNGWPWVRGVGSGFEEAGLTLISPVVGRVFL